MDKQINQPLVSIVLPVYNGEKFLAQSIQSIINQTYENWELIIVDDCSTDNSNNIAKEFARNDARIRVIKNEKNLKLPASLNAGFDFAKGKYYSWTSDDNEYYPEAFSKMVDFLEADNTLAMVYAKCKVIGTFDGDYWGNIPVTPLSLLEFPVPAACFLYRKSVADKIGGYDTNACYMEDHDYWLRILLEGPIANIEEELYMYRRHNNSLTLSTGDIASQLRIKLGIKYFPLYKKKFPEYAKEISKKWDIFEAIYNENEAIYSENKKYYDNKTLYKILKRVYKIKKSNWILKKMINLGFIYFFKAIKQYFKIRKAMG